MEMCPSQMHHTEGLVILFWLLLIGSARSIKIFDQCPEKNATLNSEPAIIQYTGYADHLIACNWTIPDDIVQNPGYIVVLWIEPTIHCPTRGSLRLPGTRNLCNDEHEYEYGCFIYTRKDHDCNAMSLTQLIHSTSNTTCRYNTTKFWEDVEMPAIIDYHVQQYFEEKIIQTQFTIHYHPIKCMTNTIERTTQSSTKIPTFLSTINDITTEISLPEHQADNPINYWTVAAVASGSFALLLIILVGTIVWCKRRKPIKEKVLQSESTNTYHSNNMYENHIETTDEAGYEIPTNARQYENFKTDGQYENLKGDDMYEDVEADNTYANTFVEA